MSYFLFMIILVISANLDVLTLGISYGVRNTKLSLFNITIISLITFLGTLLPMIFAKILSNTFIIKASNIIGNFIIILIGCFGLIKYFCAKEKEERKLEELNFKKIITLGFILSINNFALSVGFGISGFSTIITSISSLIVCFFFLYTGNLIGTVFNRKSNGHFTELFSNIIIIFCGIFNLFL